MNAEEIRRVNYPTDSDEARILIAGMVQEIAAQLADQTAYMAELLNELQMWRRQS